MGRISSTLRNLAKEAEADEHRLSHHVAQHRLVLTRAEIMAEKAHRTAKHCVHILILTGAGLPAILAFETARPLWVRYVESPLSRIMLGNQDVAHATGEYLTNTINYLLTDVLNFLTSITIIIV